MRFVLIFIALVAVLAGAYWYTRGDAQPAARVFDESVAWELVGSEENPAQAFARIVDERAKMELAEVLDIDTSEEAARSYMQQVSPELFAAERVRRDQAAASKVADALDMVLVQGVPESEVYETLNLADLMTVERWEELVITSTAEHIPTLRTFAASPAPMEEPDVTEQVVRAYMTRSIRDKICALPESYNNIRARLLARVAGDTTDPLLKDVSVFEAECTVERAKYIRRFIEQNVIVYRDELDDYSQYLTLPNEPA